MDGLFSYTFQLQAPGLVYHGNRSSGDKNEVFVFGWPSLLKFARVAKVDIFHFLS